MGNKKAVIFDLDGTLLDTVEDLTDSVNFVLQKHGREKRTIDEIREFVGNGAAKLVLRSLFCCGREDEPKNFDKGLFDVCFADFMEYYGCHSEIKTKPYENMIFMLEKLSKRGIAVGVVSNKPDFAVKQLCGKYFGEHVKVAVGDCEKFERKPAPDSTLYAIRQLVCEKAVYVGDSDVDIMTAKNAKIPCISVTWGFRDKKFLSEHGATSFADTADELFYKIIDILDTND